MNTLPTPEEALATLLSGLPITVNCHRARYVEAEGVTWFTNAYGNDGVLCQRKPDLQVVTKFLSDMAEGIDYGLTPN